MTKFKKTKLCSNVSIVRNSKLQILMQNLLSELEKKGMAKVQELRDSDSKQMIQSLQDIINDGNAEFYAANGRNMTYSEMRSTYG